MSGADAPLPGEVIPFWHLWWREHEQGEDAGRKLRPCIVVARSGGERPLLAVLPITHADPGGERDAVDVPPRVKAHLGLDSARAWIICDEQNEFTWPGFDIGKTPRGEPSFGGVPDKLFARVREAHKEARRRGALRSASRDD